MRTRPHIQTSRLCTKPEGRHKTNGALFCAGPFDPCLPFVSKEAYLPINILRSYYYPCKTPGKVSLSSGTHLCACSLRGLSDADLAALAAVLDEQVEANIGMSMVYAMVAAAKEWLQDKVRQRPFSPSSYGCMPGMHNMHLLRPVHTRKATEHLLVVRGAFHACSSTPWCCHTVRLHPPSRCSPFMYGCCFVAQVSTSAPEATIDPAAARKAAEEAEERRIAEIRSHGTMVTPQTFAEWKARFDAEMALARRALPWHLLSSMLSC